MKISVLGLGYVGVVSCGCLAKLGHRVTGVDVSKMKVDVINDGHSPVVEPEIESLISAARGDGSLTATQSVEEAVQNSDVTFISVGTPSKANGSIELAYVERVCEELGRALRNTSGRHLVVARSTMLPGSTRKVVMPMLAKHSGKSIPGELGICYNPEFLREGSSVHDFFNPPKTVIGTLDDPSAALLREIYRDLPGETVVTSLEVSEMVKYADNNFHAVKITFANEIGMICKDLGIDSHEVMSIFVKDRKLNISPSYLTPGFAFGGSCLPKDVNALMYQAKTLDLETPMLQSLHRSNEHQIQAVASKILEFGKRNVGFLGFSFKAGTDDLRGSPIVRVIEALLGKGCSVKLYDRNVQIARLIGANQSYIEQHIPHVAALMCDSIEKVVAASEVIVIGNEAEEFKQVAEHIPPGKTIFDLVRILPGKSSGEGYVGLAW